MESIFSRTDVQLKYGQTIQNQIIAKRKVHSMKSEEQNDEEFCCDAFFMTFELNIMYSFVKYFKRAVDSPVWIWFKKVFDDLCKHSKICCMCRKTP